MVRLTDDLHVIRIKRDRSIVYSPLRRGVFSVDDDGSRIVKQYISNGVILDDNPIISDNLSVLQSIDAKEPALPEIVSVDHIVIILSQICNLACTYCYAQEARASDVLTFDKLVKAIDYSFKYGNTSHKKHIGFIGGGEPLATWELIKRIILYIESSKGNYFVSYNITTNLTLLSSEIIDFSKRYNIHFNVSFEVLKDIQDSQRPFFGSSKSTYDIVYENIHKLIKNNISFGIRSTITRLNVERMPEMVEHVHNYFDGLSKLHLEQVTDSRIRDKKYYDLFIESFMKARQIGKKFGINVYNSISNSIFRIHERFCGGEFCVTPDGSIVTCHRVSSPKDLQFPTFHIGSIDDEVIINSNSLQGYFSFANKKKNECKSCFAYWHCAGICPMERSVFSKKQISMKCSFTKELVKQILNEYVSERERLSKM